MKRYLIVGYALACWVMFLGVFAYACAFVGGFLVPTTLDGPRSDPLWLALCVNVGLIAVFGVQHSVMARQWFKRWWTRFVHPAAERSTYVLISNLLMIVLFWQWRPMGGVVWHVEHEAGRIALWSLFAAGWLLVPVSSFMTDHFDLFGVRQAWLHFKGVPYRPLPFRTRALYKTMRHPLYTGWFLAFWSTPTMTVSHLLFAVLLTVYILVAVRFEERDLKELYGEDYERYTRTTPRFAPRVIRRGATAPARG
ncbi:MAG: isoprenylcysteine carboxylmethyltransferase family protein [Leptolyngbya sp. PLA2]|nr:isoprenylcysteine carboxylmethyltransferase family protein [Leptolyngbya sp.]MCE7970941.1 isoprenylcysteine carboxylmethyltransferase family protein [Leptolyngbya sp. PL-A2]MCQ3940244.1 isoprenylcysteine carboxylmethyltransferase family protein [cyanobacterium CYA1]MCZ7633783.1 isoprenylcysteine carboxylmethyltransferase family protein [Phycisphaerales bacterium]MDL1904686.1 isoprenylcysteine carboxylmethyltransferase family protein [Synechococcales cyanobacterium CNB]